MANLISSQTAAANSTDFTLTDGQSVNVSIFDATGGEVVGIAFIQKKASNSTYSNVPKGQLDKDNPTLRVMGPGTFRVAKKQSAVAFGVDKD